MCSRALRGVHCSKGDSLPCGSHEHAPKGIPDLFVCSHAPPHCVFIISSQLGGVGDVLLDMLIVARASNVAIFTAGGDGVALATAFRRACSKRHVGHVCRGSPPVLGINVCLEASARGEPVGLVQREHWSGRRSPGGIAGPAAGEATAASSGGKAAASRCGVIGG
jgi:hypothetical protein